ncbi:MAG: OmpA family protein [Saprospiraceae bacterium]|nr:OmpA family protein [Candidatus Vicinibacter affinis]
MKTAFFTLLTIILSFELFAQQTKTETVYFDYDKYHLTTEATTILDSFYRNLKTDTFDIIKIIGHTDADGKDQYNLTLSKNRTKVYLFTCSQKEFPSKIFKSNFMVKKNL